MPDQTSVNADLVQIKSKSPGVMLSILHLNLLVEALAEVRTMSVRQADLKELWQVAKWETDGCLGLTETCV